MNKYIFSVIAVSFALAGSVYAASNNGQVNAPKLTQPNQSVNSSQEQVNNQGNDTQIRSQEQLQVNQPVNGNQNQEQVNNQIRNQEQLDIDGNQIQQRDNVQARVLQIDKDFNNNQSLQRRSTVANAVQEMLQVADRNTGIGEQIRLIAQNQNQNQENIEGSLEKVQNRNGITKAILGPNYGEINRAQNLLNQNRDQIQQMEELRNQILSEEDKQTISEQIQLLDSANTEIEDLLDESQKGFSLLGWMFRFFNSK